MNRLLMRVVTLLLLSQLLVPFQTGFAQQTFTDVPKDFWAKAEIEMLNKEGIISGFPEGAFKPSDSITRTQAAAMLVRALNLKTTKRPDPGFKDISKQFHAYDVVATVADEGLMSGSAGNFRPGETLSRGQMAVILQRAFELSGKWDREFADIAATHWAYNAIQSLAANRITTGYAVDFSFRASLPTTRAQFSVFLARQLDEAFKPSETPLTNKQKAVLALYNEATKGTLPGVKVSLGSSYNDVVTNLGTPDSQGISYMQYDQSGYLLGLNPSGIVGYLSVYDHNKLTLNEVKSVLGTPNLEDVDLGEIHTIYQVGEYELVFTREHLSGNRYSNEVRQIFIRHIEGDRHFYDVDKSDWQTYENQRFGYKVEFPSHWQRGMEPTNRDGVALYEDLDSYVLVFGTDYVDEPARYYRKITLNSGKEAYFFQNELYGFVGYHMMLIEGDVTFHFTAEMPRYFFDDHQHILEEIMLNFEVTK